MSEKFIMPNKASGSNSKAIESSVTKSTHSSDQHAELFLEDLGMGISGTIVVMIGRMWDVNAVSGRYLSTDFVVTDAKGKSMHCYARSSIAHTFVGLKEGGVYSIKNFIVQPNKEDYRIISQDPFILEFDGSTIIRKAAVNPKSFIRYPFELADFDEIEPTYNKYLIDVAGYVTNVGRTIVQRSGSKTLDFQLANKRGQSIRVTLWGELGDILIEKKTKNVGLCPVILTSLNVKVYNNKIYLSSSSSTLIYDNEDIPALIDLKAEMSSLDLNKAIVPVDCSETKDGTIENLLIWGRNRKNNAMTYNCKVMINNVRTSKGWNYPACGENKCKKGATRKNNKFWCDACKKYVEYPVLRFRLELDVSDDTEQTVIVLFDEPARNLLKCSPESLLENDNEAEGSNLPQAIRNLIGTTHSFEVKASTYFEHGNFESFTCWNVTPASDEPACSSIPQLECTPPSPLMKTLAKRTLSRNSSLSTPMKSNEGTKKKGSEYDDSDAEQPHIDEVSSGDGSVSENKKRRRCVITDSDSENEEVAATAEVMKEYEINPSESVSNKVTS